MPEETEILYGPLYGVPHNALEEAWSPAWNLLNKAMERMKLYKYYSEADIRAAVENRDMQLWVTVVDDKLAAAFITQFIKYPRRKVFDVFLVGGDKLEDWVAPSWDTLKRYARSKDCDGIRGFGREGWVRVLEEQAIEYSATWDVDL